jgi:hypothetical protein
MMIPVRMVEDVIVGLTQHHVPESYQCRKWTPLMVMENGQVSSFDDGYPRLPVVPGYVPKP